MPGKRRVFTTRVEPVSPPYIPIVRDGWWRRRALPPGPQRLFHAPFITIVSKLTGHDLGCPGCRFKGFRGHSPRVRLTTVIARLTALPGLLVAAALNRILTVLRSHHGSRPMPAERHTRWPSASTQTRVTSSFATIPPVPAAEMVKVRPVVVISPRRRAARCG